MRLNFKESDLNSLWVKLFLFHSQSFVKLTEGPPLCPPFLTSQSALRIFLVGLGFWLLRTLQGPIWLTQLTIRFCLFLCFGPFFLVECRIGSYYFGSFSQLPSFYKWYKPKWQTGLAQDVAELRPPSSHAQQKCAVSRHPLPKPRII